MEKANEFVIALGLANHIQHPCGMKINGKDYDLRDFYLRLAKKTLPELKEEHTRNFLESIIKIYE